MSEALNGASERFVEFYKICSCSVISHSINQSINAGMGTYKLTDVLCTLLNWKMMDTLPGLPCVILTDAFLNLVRYDMRTIKYVIVVTKKRNKPMQYVVR